MNKENKFIRICPKCNKELFYSNKSNWRAANRINSFCRNCKIISEETKKRIGLVHKGKKISEDLKNKLKNSWVGKKHSSETILKMKEMRQHISEETREKLRNIRLGKKMSDKTREKMREIKLNNIKELGGFPSFNKKACNFIDSIKNKLSYNFQHALNGGEFNICGYSVDGYDKNNNVIFEYDEKRHENPTRKLKDLKRMEIIKNKLNCEVIRYSERFNKLYKSYSTHSIPINVEII